MPQARRDPPCDRLIAAAIASRPLAGISDKISQSVAFAGTTPDGCSHVAPSSFIY